MTASAVKDTKRHAQLCAVLTVSGSVTLDRAENEWVLGMWSVPTGIQALKKKILHRIYIRSGSSVQNVRFYEMFNKKDSCTVIQYVIECIPMPTWVNC